MKKILSVFMLVFLLMCGNALANSVYSGYLTTNDGVFATAPWNSVNGGFKIEWNHFQTGNLFTYNYEITNLNGGPLAKDVSHFVFQVSDNFTLENLKSFSGGVVTDDSPKKFYGFYGVKVEDIPETGTVSLTFTSDRMPMWGDFYAKDGVFKGNSVYAKNTCGSQIGVPDTQVVPLPGSIILLTTGLFGIVLTGVRKRNA